MSEDFFDGMEQIDLYVGDFKGKAPVFYRDARGFSAVFPANLLALRKLRPDKRLVPAQIFPGIGAVQLGAFEYRDTDVGPYNEFGVVIPLNSGQFLQVPAYNILRQLLQMEMHGYILHLPVTTEVARRGGVDYFNFPKFLASIDYTDAQDSVTCELAEQGELILRLKGRKLPAKRRRVAKTFCYTLLLHLR